MPQSGLPRTTSHNRTPSIIQTVDILDKLELERTGHVNLTSGVTRDA